MGIRSGGMYAARTIPRQRNQPCGFAARQPCKGDRQIRWGVTQGGRRPPCGFSHSLRSFPPVSSSIFFSSSLADMAAWRPSLYSPSIQAFDTAVRLLNKGLINPSKLLHSVFEKEDAVEAFETSIRPDTYRVIIKL